MNKNCNLIGKYKVKLDFYVYLIVKTFAFKRPLIHAGYVYPIALKKLDVIYCAASIKTVGLLQTIRLVVVIPALPMILNINTIGFVFIIGVKI